MEPVIELQAVTRTFGHGVHAFRAVENLTLRVMMPGIFGVLGANGSGKSTTLRMMMGLCRPSMGCVRIRGRELDGMSTIEKVGYLSENPRFPGLLTGREVLLHHARLGVVDTRVRGRQVEDTLVKVGLRHVADRRTEGYSRGMLQRLGLAQALVHHPSILILDEPTAGLDERGVDDIGALLRELSLGGVCIVVSLHHHSEVTEWCSSVALLERGHLISEGPTSEVFPSARLQSLLVDPLDEVALDTIRQNLESHRSRLHAVFSGKRITHGSPSCRWPA